MSRTSIVVGDGAEVSYTDSSPGSEAAPAVLVHGITECGECWAPVTDRLVAAGHRVVAVDLRGHGESGAAATYDLASMVGDVAAVVATVAPAPDQVRLVGHSLGGTVVSALASATTVRSTVNVDQSLELDAFQAQLQQLAPLLRDANSFEPTISAIFDELAGETLAAEERARIEALRRPVQEVVLGVWEPVIDSTVEELRALVTASAGSIDAPYLSLHGIDPGPTYPGWLKELVSTATVEVWDGLGHYPHLVDPDRFVARLEVFWQQD